MLHHAIVFGWDYLGQPIAESLTLNGTTPVVGNKAFKSFNYVTVHCCGNDTQHRHWCEVGSAV